MNREVEERIVAMYFDNKNFEKNAKETIETLGQLKEGLDLEESAKGFEVFDKIGKTLNFSKANQQLQTMRGRLTSMNGLLGKVFKIGTSPLREAESLMGKLRGYMGKVVGFDLASKIVGNVESALRSLTVAPISAGWNQYESKMDSVKTIMSSTGASIDVVNQKLDEMTDYANKTIYSLTDMTSNLGKFTNNGVGLDDAVIAMEGIANATADAGQGAQSASMAMYNISQAMGVGKMTTIDWKSLENANIATSKLKNTFLEVAAASGKLKKEVKEVNGQMKTSYWLDTDEDGKKLKQRIELTSENFREYLSKGWLDKQTMLRTFKIYGSGGQFDLDELKSWGITDPEQIKALEKIAIDAQEAATQVRTFSKMMDALKESVQSGWAQSFEIIFGNMEEGTQLWTTINNRLDNVLSAATEKRNEILRAWAESTETGEAYWTKDEQGNKVRTGAKGGREILQDAMFGLMDVAQTLGNMVSSAVKKVFGEIDGKKLLDLTIKFRDFVNRIKDWLGSVNDTTSRLYKMQKVVTGVLNIVKAGINIVRRVVNVVKRIAAPVIDWLLDKFAAVGSFFDGFGDLNPAGMIYRLGVGIKRLWNSVTGLFKADEGGESPIAKWLRNTWESAKTEIRNWADQLGLGDAFDKIASVWNTITAWPGWTDIGNFFSNIWEWIKERAVNVYNWFTQSEDGGDTGFVKFLKDVAGGISSIWGTITAWPGWASIGKFFGDVWAWLGEKANVVIGWFTQPEDGSDSGFVKFLKDIWEGIQDIWNKHIVVWPVWKTIGQFLGDTWGWISSQFSVQKKSAMIGTERREWVESAPIVGWLEGIWETIKGVWKDIAEWPVWNTIATFLGNTWQWISSQFTPQKKSAMIGTERREWVENAPIVDWLGGIWEGIKSVWNDIVKWNGWKAIGKFFTDTWGWITGLFKGEAGSTAGASKEAVAAAQGTEVTAEATKENVGFVTQIIDALKSLFDSIGGIVIPPAVQTFLDGLGKFFEGLMTWIGRILGSAGKMMQGDFTDLTALIPIVIAAIVKVLDMIDNKHLAEINGSQNFAQKFLEIAGGLFLLASGVAMLTAIDQGKMWSAVGAIAVLGAVVAAIIVALEKLTEAKTQNEKVTSVERVISNLINTLGKVGMLYVALKLLPDIITTIGEVKKDLGGDVDIGDDVLKAMLGLVAVVSGISIVMAAVQRLTGNAGLNIGATFQTVVSVLEAMGFILIAFMGTGGLLGLIKKLGGDTAINVIVDGINQLGEVFSAIGGVLGGFFASLFGGGSPEQKATESAKATRTTLEAMSEMADAFDMEKISGISRIITMIQSLSNGSELIDSSKLENFATAMQRIGAGIYEIATYILDMKGPLSEINDPGSEMSQKLTSFISFTGQIIDAIAPLGNDMFRMGKVLDSIDALAKEENLKTFVEHLNTIMMGLGDLNQPDSGIQFDGLTIVGKLFKAIQDGLIDPSLPKFDATPVVDAIVEALQLGDKAIAQIVHDMVQNGLNLNKNPTGGTEGYNNNTDELGLFAGLLNGEGLNTSQVVDNFQTQLLGEDGNGGILSVINDLENKIPSMSSVFEDKGWMDFTDENGQPIDILGEVQGHLTELGDTLSTMEPLKITITPVFDYSGLTPEAIQQGTGSMPVVFSSTGGTPQLSISFDGLANALDMEGLRSRLDAVTAAIIAYCGNTNTALSAVNSSVVNLGSHMDGIAAEVSRLQFMLDGEALVGYITPKINKRLGWMTLLESRR